jgi:hypothetical protein
MDPAGCAFDLQAKRLPDKAFYPEGRTLDLNGFGMGPQGL